LPPHRSKLLEAANGQTNRRSEAMRDHPSDHPDGYALSRKTLAIVSSSGLG